MPHSSDAQTIREQINSLWSTEQPTINLSFSDVDYKPTEGNAWVRVNILSGSQTQVGFGDLRRFRRVGVVAIQIFVPAGSGDGQAREIADSVANILQGRTLNGVILRGTGLTRVGIDGAWSVWSADTPYQADDCVAIN
jgi:hypothetical protein